MTTPKRIQRRRTPGWRMPDDAVYVGRPGRYGNPYWDPGRRTRLHITPHLLRTELGGHDLACWCPLDQPCHADVLLDLANRPEPT